MDRGAKRRSDLELSRGTCLWHATADRGPRPFARHPAPNGDSVRIEPGAALVNDYTRRGLHRKAARRNRWI